ncbi:MAG TPA: 4-hydroxybenzoate 3-monooxygenase [Xanthobacteraceae bacterium]|nr:4-hydroxybenzoate 3-monooxygenase [Xanthobacteraceae bacterium]
MRTQVGIVGAGPAGLLLAHLLDRAGIDCVVLEARSRAYCEERQRAGLLEQGTVDLLNELNVGDRLAREGLVHRGLALRFDGVSHRIPLSDLTGGKSVVIYGQTEVVKDLIAAWLAAGRDIRFEAEAFALEALDTSAPLVRFREPGGEQTLACDFVAGCDGFHGICRAAIPPSQLAIYERDYPFGWIGILSESPPVSHELIYVNHDRGFALFTMRTPQVSRLYLQCEVDEDIGNWPDARIWDELRRRLGDGPALPQGAVTQKNVTPMRSFVAAPMRHGALFLAGDAAHIVPPTGAKGLNLAAADVRVLARALIAFYAERSPRLLDRYSDVCLKRVWKAQRFSWWMTSLLHRFHDHTPFERRMQLAELDYVAGSQAGMTTLAENYVGLPFEDL